MRIVSACHHQYINHLGGRSVDVYLPQGKWYDWYTHQVVSAEGEVTKAVDTPIDMIPVCYSACGIHTKLQSIYM